MRTNGRVERVIAGSSSLGSRELTGLTLPHSAAEGTGSSPASMPRFGRGDGIALARASIRYGCDDRERLSQIEADTQVVGIDEAQFLDMAIIDAVNDRADRENAIIIAARPGLSANRSSQCSRNFIDRRIHYKDARSASMRWNGQYPNARESDAPSGRASENTRPVAAAV